jgi:hypothetical protein
MLLTGKLHPRNAAPVELAYATRHVLTHRNLDASVWHHSREEDALRELRASLGSWPEARFGRAALLAVAAAPRGECRRCRAAMLSRAHGLVPPALDEATSYLLGPGCARCRSRVRAGGASPFTVKKKEEASPARHSSESWLSRLLARRGLSWRQLRQEHRQDVGLYGQRQADDRLRRKLATAWVDGLPKLPPISDSSVHPGLK